MYRLVLEQAEVMVCFIQLLPYWHRDLTDATWPQKSGWVKAPGTITPIGRTITPEDNYPQIRIMG